MPIPQPPNDLLEFRRLNKYEKEKISLKLFEQGHIKTYMDDKWKAELHNRDSFLWLWEVYKTETDQARRHALENKLDQFKKVIQRQENTFQALLLDFKKYPFERKPQPAQWQE